MSKKKKKKSAEKLEAQARMHEALYGAGWEEAMEYRRQALNILKKHDIKTNNKKISDNELKLFKKRLIEFEEGKREMKKELPFYKVLRSIEKGTFINSKDEVEIKNLQLLELLGYIKNSKLTGKGKKLLRRLEK